jgi:hypothetical protein
MLKLSLKQPEHGWVAVCLQAESSVIEFVASDVPNNPIQELVDALFKVYSGQEAEVWWHLEPDGYYFRFTPQENRVTLRVSFSEGSNEGSRRELLVLIGQQAEILLPIWRALRRFEAFRTVEPHWPDVNFRHLKELGPMLRA